MKIRVSPPRCVDCRWLEVTFDPKGRVFFWCVSGAARRRRAKKRLMHPSCAKFRPRFPN